MKLLNKIMFWFTGIVFLVTPISMFVSYNNIKAQIDKSHEQRMAYENSLIAKELLKGTTHDKLYNCVMVYSVNEYYYPGMDSRKPYYFAIEAINENGCSEWVKGEAL